MQGKKVLIVDDDPLMRELVGQVVIRSKNQVISAENGAKGLHEFYESQPDLVILDVSMPGMNGWEVCRHIRQYSQIPIIMLTSLGDEQDIVRGFNEGADDYVIKPFNPNILQARIEAALRRGRGTVVSEQPTIYSDDYLTFDRTKRRILVDGEVVKLTATEYRLLAFLLQYPNQVLSLEQILENVWGAECRENTDYVHVYMWHLRRKLEKNPKDPKYLLTEHGIGYRFQKAAVQVAANLPKETMLSQAVQG
ncbi:MAG: response regulator transcription factor [Anaerolineae bacterium]|nr:response regulator transcription factor [Anaerolineae bacterium]